MNIVELYNRLRNTQNADFIELTQAITSYQSNIESFDELVGLIMNPPDKYIQNQATISLGKCIKSNREQLLMNESCVITILNLAYFPNSEFVRENITFYITYSFYKPELAEHIYNFIRNYNISSIIDLQATLKLLIVIIDDLVNTNIDIDNAAQYISEIIKQANEANILDNWMILIVKLSQLQSNDFCTDLPNIVVKAVEHLQNLANAQQNYLCFKFCQFFSDFIEGEIPGFLMMANEAAAAQLFEAIKFSFPKLIEIIQNNSIFETIRRNVINVCNSLLEKYTEQIQSGLQQELVQLLQAYTIFIIETFNSTDEEVNLLFDNDYQYFIPYIINDYDIFSYVFELISNLEDTEVSIFAKISLLTSTFDENCSFYDEEHLNFAIALLKNGIECESEFIRSLSASSINIFAQAFKANNIDDLLDGILETLKGYPAEQYLETLNSIIERLPSTDLFFENIKTILIEIISSNSFTFSAFKCLASLLKGSEEIIIFHVEIVNEIYGYIQPFLSSEDPGIRQLAIYTVSILISIVPNIFTSELEGLIQLIIEDFHSESPSFEAIHTFSVILNNFDKSLFSEILRPVLEIIMSNVINSKANIGDEFNFSGEFDPEEDSNDYSANNSLIIASAIKLACQIISLNIHEFTDLIVPLFEYLNNQISSFSSAVKSSCAVGLRYILQGITVSDEITNQVLINVTTFTLQGVTSASDMDSLNEFFITLAKTIDFYSSRGISLADYVQKLYIAIDIATNGNPMIRAEDLSKTDKSSLDFIHSLLSNQYMQQIVLESDALKDIVVNYFEGPKDQTYAFDFFAKSVNLIPREMLQVILEICINDPSAYNTNGHALRCLTAISVALHRNDIFDTIFDTAIKLFDYAKENGNEALSVSCMVTFARLQRVMATKFPYDQLPVDLDANSFVTYQEYEVSECLIDFFFAFQSVRNVSVLPLIRIMSTNPKILAQRNLSATTLMRMKSLISSEIGPNPNYEEIFAQVYGGEDCQYKILLFQQNMQ